MNIQVHLCLSFVNFAFKSQVQITLCLKIPLNSPRQSQPLRVQESRWRLHTAPRGNVRASLACPYVLTSDVCARGPCTRRFTSEANCVNERNLSQSSRLILPSIAILYTVTKSLSLQVLKI